MFGDKNIRILGAEARRARSVGATLRRLLRYFRPYRWALLLVAVFVIAGTYMQVLVPDLTGQAVDGDHAPDRHAAGDQQVGDRKLDEALVSAREVVGPASQIPLAALQQERARRR